MRLSTDYSTVRVAGTVLVLEIPDLPIEGGPSPIEDSHSEMSEFVEDELGELMPSEEVAEPVGGL